MANGLQDCHLIENLNGYSVFLLLIFVLFSTPDSKEASFAKLNIFNLTHNDNPAAKLSTDCTSRSFVSLRDLLFSSGLDSGGVMSPEDVIAAIWAW